MTIEYTSVERVPGYWRAVDAVARERRYLLFTEAPAIARTEGFVADIIANEWSQFFAVEGEEVVGWCDVIPFRYDGCRHNAHLGMGVLASHRRQGIGEQLIRTTIAHAESRGIERIELEVFSTNPGAIALYEKVGFGIEGRKVGARRLDGIEHDFVLMARHKKSAVG